MKVLKFQLKLKSQQGVEIILQQKQYLLIFMGMNRIQKQNENKMCF